MTELIVLLGEQRVGRLLRSRAGRSEFEYDSAWQTREDAYPLSLSMPLGARFHPAKVVEPYLWGLLPENEVVLERWARRFQVSAHSAFALLTHVGEDCPGAVRIVRPDRDSSGETAQRGTEWLSEADVAARLRALRVDVSAWRNATDTGQFSLAGAQPKTALWFDGERWGLPYGSTPTTHILKPGVLDLEGSAENEHFCLQTARALGLPAAESRIMQFEDQSAIVVARYDRVATASGTHRIHQEDMCQALAVHPVNKYENEGGPGARAIAQLLRENSFEPDEDVNTFITALILSWLIGGTDAHAKNYALLIGASARVRLAPLYDLASALPYSQLAQQKLKLAMKIGGKYRLRDIAKHQWEKLATELSLRSDTVLSIARDCAARLPEVATAVLEQSQSEGLRHPVLERLRRAVSERARECARLLET